MIAILDGIAKWAQRTHDVAEIMAEIVAKNSWSTARALALKKEITALSRIARDTMAAIE